MTQHGQSSPSCALQGKVLNVAADLRTLLQHQGLDFEEQVSRGWVAGQLKLSGETSSASKERPQPTQQGLTAKSGDHLVGTLMVVCNLPSSKGAFSCCVLQSLAVAIYEPKEPRLGGHHPPLRYRYNEVLLPVSNKQLRQ